MTMKDECVTDCRPAIQLQHYSQSEAKALRSIYNYYRGDDNDASTSVICLAAINDLGRNHHERSRMKIAMEEFHQSSRETSANSESTSKIAVDTKSTSFLLILDAGRKLLSLEHKAGQENKEENEDDLTSQKYHFLRLLHEYQTRCNAEGKYLLAKEFVEHELRLRKEEEERQVVEVKRKHNRNRSKISVAHTEQMEEFRETWDKFMDDFEQKSQDYVKEINDEHQRQLSSLRQSMTDSMNTKPIKWSRDLIQYRKRQQLMADQHRYHEAQQTKLAGDALEEKEREDVAFKLKSSLERRERTLKGQQQTEMDVLMKRIESKRREYARQSEEDCARLLQRNKNIQATIDSKHVSSPVYMFLIICPSCVNGS
mmetsp:Transcript_40612/g.84996  ORF Transcript_40612/g.84996 Transcript_40612/m.84996 type:complete len:370 (+) Transcript_40612:247-1356(+)